eukprot:GFYU01006008.1.p1 GENE.GFYU01006008.1~~GFYU01006008.1.p1  ORF type:complete len:646 (+),score=161.89 GFYU01006008.1:130-2067(+)
MTDDSRSRAIFKQHASVTIFSGEKLMTPKDFVNSMKSVDGSYELTEAKMFELFRFVDVDDSGWINETEYLKFHAMLDDPEGDYLFAFRLFDEDGNGTISLEEFKKKINAKRPFDFECQLIKRFFGKRGKRELTYKEFSQFMQNYQDEAVLQEYMRLKKDTDGIVRLDEFRDYYLQAREVPPFIKDNMDILTTLSPEYEGRVSYIEVLAFDNVLRQIDTVHSIFDDLFKPGVDHVSRGDFIRRSRYRSSFGFAPLELDIIFKVYGQNKGKPDNLARSQWDKVKATVHTADDGPLKQQSTPATPEATNNSWMDVIKESITHFLLGAVAGGIGAAAVYPIDLVKTRMQNQRSTVAGEMLYKNSFDCFKQVVAKEGVPGLYRGILPQTVGVAPEKAIKLTVNDLLRGWFARDGQQIHVPLEILAGGGAGASQVVFTNPLEIVKIRLQLEGELAAKTGAKPSGAMTIIRELGLSGLYKGAPACFLRDIPFSAIYFPSYAHVKEMFKNNHADGVMRPTDLLMAGAIAGIPAASLTTPADVIKTRLQAKLLPGQQGYNGIGDCFARIVKEEGATALFKGAGARVFRSSPQFGVTLLAYEVLQKMIAPDLTPRPPTSAPIDVVDYFEALRAKQMAANVHSFDKKVGLLSPDKQ